MNISCPDCKIWCYLLIYLTCDCDCHVNRKDEK